MTVGEQKEGSEMKRKKQDEFNRENSYTETDTIEDDSDTNKSTRSQVNPWRDSGYITSDSEDFIMKKFKHKAEIDEKKQNKIASIFWSCFMLFRFYCFSVTSAH